VPHIRQIVMNLVTNASEAIGDRDGVIRLTTGRVTQAGLRRSRNIVRRMLRRTGFAGSAAIELLRANGRKIDGILLDMTIPGAPVMKSLLKPRKVGRI
jgi:nitrogen-specific signal transduction histidine kinase